MINNHLLEQGIQPIEDRTTRRYMKDSREKLKGNVNITNKKTRNSPPTDE